MIKVSDFGLSRILRDDESVYYMHSGGVCVRVCVHVLAYWATPAFARLNVEASY